VLISLPGRLLEVADHRVRLAVDRDEDLLFLVGA
jgi:hypothetical protein